MNSARDNSKNTESLDHSAVVSVSGDTTHVLVPKDEYAELKKRAAQGSKSDGPSQEALADALRILKDPKTRWVDANEVVHELVAGGVAAARRARGLSQGQLGQMLGVAQSQVSRYEKNLEGMTLRVLRRIAEALSGRYPDRAGGRLRAVRKKRSKATVRRIVAR